MLWLAASCRAANSGKSRAWLQYYWMGKPYLCPIALCWWQTARLSATTVKFCCCRLRLAIWELQRSRDSYELHNYGTDFLDRFFTRTVAPGGRINSLRLKVKRESQNNVAREVHWGYQNLWKEMIVCGPQVQSAKKLQTGKSINFYCRLTVLDPVAQTVLDLRIRLVCNNKESGAGRHTLCERFEVTTKITQVAVTAI